MRNFTFLALLFAVPALAGPPGLAPSADRGERRGPPSPELIDKVKDNEVDILMVVKENDPGRYEQLMDTKRTDERAYWRQMVHVARMVDRVKSDPEYPQRNMDMHLLQKQIKEKARAYDDLSAADQKTAYAEMEVLTAELFEMKQADRRQRIEELQRKLKDLEADIEQREENKEDKIKEYLDTMVRGRVDL